MSHDSLLCWCGNNHLQRFSPEYDRCLKCETLISRHKHALTAGLTAEGDKGFYGRKYYESHLVEKYHYPSLPERARGDLSERCIHWLQILLHYQLPPSRILEIGSGHGGFVALARWAGFEAVGLEISSWVVDFAKETFQIPMLLGSVENQVLQPSSLGAVILMDVLEHFPDPCGTMRTCFDWLKPDGIFLVQTPKYSGDSTYDQLVARKDRVFKMLNAEKIVPTGIENRLAGMNPYIRHVVVTGAGRSFLAALIFPDFFRIAEEFGDDQATADRMVKESLRETILAFNREHPVKYERIRYELALTPRTKRPSLSRLAGIRQRLR